MAEQRFGEPLAERGWVCAPARGRLLMFEGSLLHGVLPAYTGAHCTVLSYCFTLLFWAQMMHRSSHGKVCPAADANGRLVGH